MRILALCVVMLLLNACNQQPKYSTEVTDFLENHPEVHVFYLYESTLRMLNTVFEGGVDSAFSSVDQARIGLLMGEESVKVMPDLSQLYLELESAGAEILFSIRRDNTTSAAFQTGKNDDGYLLCISDQHSTFLLEIVGKMELQDIQSLSTMDFEKIATVFDIKEPKSEGDTKSNPKNNPDSTSNE